MGYIDVSALFQIHVMQQRRAHQQGAPSSDDDLHVDQLLRLADALDDIRKSLVALNEKLEQVLQVPEETK